MSGAVGLGPLLQPLELALQPREGELLPQVEAALAAHGRPLRWAITAVTAAADGGRVLQIEAVVLRPHCC